MAHLSHNSELLQLCKIYADRFGLNVFVVDVEGAVPLQVTGAHGRECLCNPFRDMGTFVPMPETDTKVHGLHVMCACGFSYLLTSIVLRDREIGRLLVGPRARGMENEKIPSIMTALHQTVDAMMQAFLKKNASWEPLQKMHIQLENAHQELAQARSRLQELAQLKSSFLGTVSHELRTPLTSIIGYAESLMEGLAGSLNSEQRGYVEIILQSGASLLNLISQILELARVEAETATLEQKMIDVVPVIQRALADVEPARQKRQINFNLSIDRTVPPIAADPEKLRQIIGHLLSNAVKFTPAGGDVQVLLRLVQDRPSAPIDSPRSTKPCQSFLELQVHDTGIGIPADKLERIFDSFYQVDNGERRHFGGSGLGLALVRHLVQAHHGHVEVVSEIGAGSTFVVKLPYNLQEPVAMAEDGGWR